MPMDFASAKGKVRDLVATRARDLSQSALTPDKLRDRIVRDAASNSERFRTAANRRPEITYERRDDDGNTVSETHEWDTYGEAVRDYARASFTWDEPEILPRDRVRPSHRLNREVMQAVLGSEEFREARPYTRNNELESLYGAMAASDSLKESASNVLAEHIARSEQISEAEQQQQSADDLFDQLRQQAGQETAEHGTAQPDTRRAIKQALKQQAQAQQALGNLMQQQQQSSMAADAIAAGEAAAQAGAEAVEMLSSLPGTENGTPETLPPDQQIALAEKWSKHAELKAVARRLGRLFRSMRFKREARTQHVQIEPVGVTTGNSLEHMLPMEGARMMSPVGALRALFWRDYSEHRLLQFDMEGRQPAGKGPIVFVRDGSGSMTLDFGGCSRSVWACSLGLALLGIAGREKRAFAGVEFGSATEQKTWYFPKREPADPERVLDYATHQFSGGTSTEHGMAEALRIILQEDGFTTADVILVGDGEDTFGAEDLRIRNALRERGVRIHGISIATPGNAYMAQMCDEVVDVANLADEDEATTALANNIT